MPPQELLELNKKIGNQLAPDGILKAGIYLGNFLLVTGKSSHGDPIGVSPSLAKSIADHLSVKLQLVPFNSQGELVDAVAQGRCGIGLVGSDPARAEKITFARAYVEIEATYLVPSGSTLNTVSDVDRPGIRIASFADSAYDLWLVRNIKKASLIHADSLLASYDLFVKCRLEALAGLRAGLIDESKKLPGSRILDGKFTSVQQGVATKKTSLESIQFLEEFMAKAKLSGLIQSFITQHHVTGLSIPN